MLGVATLCHEGNLRLRNGDLTVCNLSMWQHKAWSLCAVNCGSVQGLKVEVNVSAVGEVAT